jgi:transcriptional regulator with XRE-family HTH domain
MDFWGGAADVGLRVARLREQQGWSYRELEDATDGAGHRVSASVLFRIERGGQEERPQQKISVDDLVTLCRVFDVRPDDMLTSAEILDTREGDRILASLTAAADAYWRGAQGVFHAAAEAGGKFGRRIGRTWHDSDAREKEVGEYILNRLAHDIREHEQVHPSVTRMLSSAFTELVQAGFMYPTRRVQRVDELKSARRQLAEAEAELATSIARDDDEATLKLARSIVATATELVAAGEALHLHLNQWESDHPIESGGEEL